MSRLEEAPPRGEQREEPPPSLPPSQPQPQPQSQPPPAPATSPSAARADVLATLAIIGVLLAIAAWDPITRRLTAHPSAEQCRALLNRYVEHIAYAVDPSPSPSALADRRALAREAARSRTAFARCEGELTSAEVDCAMHAPSADTFERCLPQR